jgi:hypothetical protein
MTIDEFPMSNGFRRVKTRMTKRANIVVMLSEAKHLTPIISAISGAQRSFASLRMTEAIGYRTIVSCLSPQFRCRVSLANLD